VQCTLIPLTRKILARRSAAVRPFLMTHSLIADGFHYNHRRWPIEQLLIVGSRYKSEGRPTLVRSSYEKRISSYIFNRFAQSTLIIKFDSDERNSALVSFQNPSSTLKATVRCRHGHGSSFRRGNRQTRSLEIFIRPRNPAVRLG